MTRVDNPNLNFNFISLNEILDRVNKWNPKKNSQATDTPVKIIKKNKDFLLVFTFSINSSMHYQNAHQCIEIEMLTKSW